MAERGHTVSGTFSSLPPAMLNLDDAADRHPITANVRAPSPWTSPLVIFSHETIRDERADEVVCVLMRSRDGACSAVAQARRLSIRSGCLIMMSTRMNSLGDRATCEPPRLSSRRQKWRGRLQHSR